FSLDAAVCHIERARSEQHAGRILLVGLSLGGYVAMAYARRFPEHVAGLALAGCSVRFKGRMRFLTRLSAATFALIGHGPFLAHLSRRQVARVRAQYPAALAEAQIEAGFSYANWGRALAQMAGTDFDSMLATFPRPTLLLNGELDTYNRAAEAACAATMPGADFHVIQGAGHLCNLDAPALFTGELRTFASSLSW
ncbi:MAG: alpha/beta fold hydrolase, partial [Ktedonobacterales bacterium]